MTRLGWIALAVGVGLVPVTTGAQVASRPTVVVLTTGGTIASRPGGSLAGDSLVGAVPQLLDYADIRVEEIYRIGSSQMTPVHWLELAQRVDVLFAAEAALTGIVVTHGTDTLEETAFFLNLTVRDRRPVVLVGSMRPANAISADGPANLLNAVRVAVAPDAGGHGVLVVLNEAIGAARIYGRCTTNASMPFNLPTPGSLAKSIPTPWSSTAALCGRIPHKRPSM